MITAVVRTIVDIKMVYAGLKDEQRMKDLIAYLKQFDTAGKKAP